eukprot:1194251-Prorocentrum_minimum.AAC.11
MPVTSPTPRTPSSIPTPTHPTPLPPRLFSAGAIGGRIEFSSDKCPCRALGYSYRRHRPLSPPQPLARSSRPFIPRADPLLNPLPLPLLQVQMLMTEDLEHLLQREALLKEQLNRVQ